MELAFWNGLQTVFYDIWTINRWRAVVGYEGLYEVDWLCNVRSLNYRGTGRTQILKARKKKLVIFLLVYGKMEKRNSF